MQHICTYICNASSHVYIDISYIYICLLLFYVLAISVVIPGWVLISDCARSWRLYIGAPHWETKPPAPCPDIRCSHIILTMSQPVLALMSSTWLGLGSDKYKFKVIRLAQPWFKPSRVRFLDLPKPRWMLYSFGHPIWSNIYTIYI